MSARSARQLKLATCNQENVPIKLHTRPTLRSKFSTVGCPLLLPTSCLMMGDDGAIDSIARYLAGCRKEDPPYQDASAGQASGALVKCFDRIQGGAVQEMIPRLVARLPAHRAADSAVFNSHDEFLASRQRRFCSATGGMCIAPANLRKDTHIVLGDHASCQDPSEEVSLDSLVGVGMRRRSSLTREDITVRSDDALGSLLPGALRHGSDRNLSVPR